MKAMVLAAGLGKRLRPLTLTTPKPLIPVGGTPVLHIILKMLRRDGFEEVVINVHHLGEKIRSSVSDGSDFGLRVKYSVEEKILGTGGGIKGAEKLLGRETFLVINADVLMEIDLKEVVRFHRERGGAATLVVRDDPSAPGYGAVKVDEGGRIADILGLVDKSPALLPRLFTGVHVLEPVFFDYLQEGSKASVTQDVYPRMIRDGLEISAFEHRGYFRDLGTPESYELAQKEYSR